MKKLTGLLARLLEDPATHWIVAPLQRLLLEVVYTLSFCLISSGKMPLRKHLLPLLKTVLEELQSMPVNSIQASLIHEAVLVLNAILTDAAKEAFSAGTKTIVGAVKSFLTMKIDKDLIDGVSKGIMAGYDMFKHCQAEKQVSILMAVYPPNVSIDYNELMKSSKALLAVEGNWYDQYSMYFIDLNSLLIINFLGSLPRGIYKT